MSEELIRETFKDMGEIGDIYMPRSAAITANAIMNLVHHVCCRDRASGRSKGFCFVRFVLLEDAEKCCEKMDGYSCFPCRNQCSPTAILVGRFQLDGRELKVQLARYGRPEGGRSEGG